MDSTPTTATGRSAIVAIALSKGARLTTREVACMTGLSRYGAYALLCRLCYDLPLTSVNGRWFLISAHVDAELTGTG